MAIGTTAALIMAAGAGGSAGLSFLGAKKQADAAKGAANTQSAAAKEIAQNAIATGNEAAAGMDAATQQAVTGVNQGVTDANGVLQQVYDTAGAATDPFRQAGTSAVTRLSDLASGPGFQYDQFADPGTQFRMDAAKRALERNFSARGDARGGAFARALNREIQGLASDEFGKAFDRFRAERSDRAGMLGGLINAGQTATGQFLGAGQNFGNNTSANITRGAETAGAFGMQGAGQAGGFRMQGNAIAGNAIAGGANAQAAGQIASGNAISGALSNLGGTATDAILLGHLLKQPTPNTTGTR